MHARLFDMEPNRDLATWLLGNRRQIEGVLSTRLGPAAPRASGPEAETLRRFRTFASTALMRGEAPAPALDGLRPDERRVMALLSAWADAAAQLAGPQGETLRHALDPLLDHFRLSLRTTRGRPRAKGSPRVRRRAVVAAIDRVLDAFLAVDVGDGKIVDANPAAGALLGLESNALLGIDLVSFVPRAGHRHWWSQLDAIAEGNDAQRFHATLADVNGTTLRLEASATRFATRGRTLALVLLRPETAPAATLAIPRASTPPGPPPA